MKHIQISPGDPAVEVYIFIEADAAGCAKLRPQYADMVCPGRRVARIGPGRPCGKIDEYKALERGVDEKVRVRTKRDIVRTLDECIIVSEKFKLVTEEHGLYGVDYVPLHDGRHYVVRPTLLMPVDAALSGVEFKGPPCNVCGRYPQTKHWPAISSIQVPVDPLAMFSTDIRHEAGLYRFCDLYISDVAASILQKSHITGIDWKASINLSLYLDSPTPEGVEEYRKRLRALAIGSV